MPWPVPGIRHRGGKAGVWLYSFYMSANAELLGAEIGGYVLERRLGTGASATVYLAHDGAGNPVAFKLLAPGAS